MKGKGLIKETFYLVIIACAALSATLLKSMALADETYWIIWTALLLSTLCLQQNFKSNTHRVLLTGFIAALLVFIQSAFITTFAELIIFLAIITFIAMLYSQLYPEWFISAFIINICVFLSSFYPLGDATIAISRYTLSAAETRAVYMIEGTIIAWLPQLLLWRNLFISSHKIVRNEFFASAVEAIEMLRTLNKTIFACFLAPEYQDNIYLYERRIHVQKDRIIKSIVHMRKLIKDKSLIHDTNLIRSINQFDLLLDLALDYAQLRRRVKDNTIYAVCFTELTAICNEIDSLLADMISSFPNIKYHLSTQGLLEKINRLEEVYQNVLQVTSREPLVFLLFITSLKCFCKELAIFYEILLSNRGKADEHANNK